MRVVVSASDPGAANAVFPLIRKLKKHTLLNIIEGPAKKIFCSWDIDFKDSDKISQAELERMLTKFKPNLFLAGTSVGPTIDKKVLYYCKKRKIRSIYILDYWSNYVQRFSNNPGDFKFLPDLICVMDDLAKKEMVKLGFNPKVICVTGNPYFEYFTTGFGTSGNEHDSILFISQPLSRVNKTHKLNMFGFDEFSVFDDLLAVLSGLKKQDVKLSLRLHPKDYPSKYNSYLKKHGNVKIDRLDLKNSLKKHGLVFGMNSIVLYLANLVGRNVVSYQPGLSKNELIREKSILCDKIVTAKSDLAGEIKRYLEGNFKAKSTVNYIKGPIKNIINLIENEK